MNISTKSLAYKLVKGITESQPSTLCSFFWSLVLSIAFLPLAGLTEIIIIPYLAFKTYRENKQSSTKKSYKQIRSHWIKYDVDIPYILLITLIPIFTCIAIIFGVGIVMFTINYWYIVLSIIAGFAIIIYAYKNKILSSSVVKVTTEYVKANKSKICPMITYVDQE